LGYFSGYNQVGNDMERLKKIDEEISKQLKLVKEKVSKNDFKKIIEFSLSNDNELGKIYKSYKKTEGIYLFEIKNPELIEFKDWINGFMPKFRGKDNKYLQKWTPNIVKIRVDKHSGKMEWIPLYIGKSKKIGDRLNKHINSEIGKPPSALKLKQRNNLNNEIFRIKYIEVKVTNYDVIVPEIEKYLRKEINPIAGK
jgi:hypothetical protein